MKTKLLFLTLLFTTFIATGTYSADIRLAPYYSMEWTEGVSFPRPELTGWFFSGDLITDLGLIAKIGEKYTSQARDYTAPRAAHSLILHRTMWYFCSISTSLTRK